MNFLQLAQDYDALAITFRQACSYPPQPLRGLLSVLLLGEQRHEGCKQFA